MSPIVFLRISAALIALVGALFMGFSVKENPGSAHQVVNGKRRYLAVIHRPQFLTGVGLMILSFIIQAAIEVVSLVIAG